MKQQTVRFGVIGTGKITGKFLASAVHCEGFVLSAVCSRNAETGQAFAEEYGAQAVFTNPREMAASGVIDAAYIASPTAKHYEQAKILLENGISVLCEKPFVTNSREAEELIRIAEERGVFVMEAMRSLAMPGFLAVKEYLPSLGKIRRVFSSKCQYSSRYDRFKEGIVENAFIKELSNGALMDIGRYCVAPVIELFGMPEKVMAGAQFLSTGVDAQGTAVLSYGDMDCVLLYSKVSDSLLPFEIQGEDGILTADDIYEFRNVRISYRDGRTETLDLDDSDPSEKAASAGVDDNTIHVGPLVMTYEIREFLRCVREGQTDSPLVSHAQTLSSMRVMDEIRRQIGLVYPADCL